MHNHIIITAKHTLNAAYVFKQAQNVAQILLNTYILYTSEAQITCFTGASWRKIIASQAKYVA